MSKDNLSNIVESADRAAKQAALRGGTMRIEMDEHVKLVMEFMQHNVPADKLVGVASAVNGLAPSMWQHYGTAPVYPISLDEPKIGAVDKEHVLADI